MTISEKNSPKWETDNTLRHISYSKNFFLKENVAWKLYFLVQQNFCLFAMKQGA